MRALTMIMINWVRTTQFFADVIRAVWREPALAMVLLAPLSILVRMVVWATRRNREKVTGSSD